MKKFNKILIGIFTFGILISLFNVTTVLGADATIPVVGNTITSQVQAHNRTMFQFQYQTRLTFTSNVNIDVNIDCDSFRIGEKDFEIEIDADGDLEMTMTCREEQIQLGLQKGSTFRIRERHRYRYEEGFCLQIQCNGTCDAKLKIQATNENRNGEWAYYDEAEEEWVTVPTTIEDGNLVAETDHFSYWTILLPVADNTLWIYISVGAAVIGVAVIAVVLVIYLKKRK